MYCCMFLWSGEDVKIIFWLGLSMRILCRTFSSVNFLTLFWVYIIYLSSWSWEGWIVIPTFRSYHILWCVEIRKTLSSLRPLWTCLAYGFVDPTRCLLSVFYSGDFLNAFNLNRTGNSWINNWKRLNDNFIFKTWAFVAFHIHGLYIKIRKFKR